MDNSVLEDLNMEARNFNTREAETSFQTMTPEDIAKIVTKKVDTPYVFIENFGVDGVSTTENVFLCENNGCNLQLKLGNIESFDLRNPPVTNNNNAHLLMNNIKGNNYVLWNGEDGNNRFNIDSIFIFGAQSDKVVVNSNTVNENSLQFYLVFKPATIPNVSPAIQKSILIISIIADGTTSTMYQNHHQFMFIEGIDAIPDKNKKEVYNSSSEFPYNLDHLLPTQRSFFTTNLSDTINYIIFRDKIHIPMNFLTEFKKKVYSPGSAQSVFNRRLLNASSATNPEGALIFYNQNMPMYVSYTCGTNCNPSMQTNGYQSSGGENADTNNNRGVVCPPRRAPSLDLDVDMDMPEIPKVSIEEEEITPPPVQVSTCPPAVNKLPDTSPRSLFSGIITSLVLATIWTGILYVFIKMFKKVDSTGMKIILCSFFSLSLVSLIMVIAGVIMTLCVREKDTYEENEKSKEKWRTLTLIFSILWAFFTGSAFITAILVNAKYSREKFNNGIIYNESGVPISSFNNNGKFKNLFEKKPGIFDKIKGVFGKDKDKIRDEFLRTGKLPKDITPDFLYKLGPDVYEKIAKDYFKNGRLPDGITRSALAYIKADNYHKYSKLMGADEAAKMLRELETKEPSMFDKFKSMFGFKSKDSTQDKLMEIVNSPTSTPDEKKKARGLLGKLFGYSKNQINKISSKSPQTYKLKGPNNENLNTNINNNKRPVRIRTKGLAEPSNFSDFNNLTNKLSSALDASLK